MRTITRQKLTCRQGGCYADIYSYYVDEARKKKTGLIIKVGDETMTLDYKQLKNYELLNDTIFKSKFGGQDYKLYSYRWKPTPKLTEDQKLQQLCQMIF